MIIVTPYIVRPVNNVAALHLPSDGYKAPTDLERLLLMRQVAEDKPPCRCAFPAMPASSFSEADMSRSMTLRFAAVASLVVLAGCDSRMIPYLRTDVWQPTGANAGNIAAMVADPHDLISGRGVAMTERQRIRHWR